jgi:hypothetical protein
MAIHKLPANFVESVRKKGLYNDGGGLYAQAGAAKPALGFFAIVSTTANVTWGSALSTRSDSREHAS